MWSDRETALDLINVQHLAAAVVNIVQTDHLLPTTIGIYGDWGSGKSSLVSMVRKTLEEAKAAVCISFDASLFEGYEDAKAALTTAILDELSGQPSLAADWKQRAKSLIGRVRWLRVGSIAGKGFLSLVLGEPVLGLAAVRDFLDYLRGLDKVSPENVEELAKKFEAVKQEVGPILDAEHPTHAEPALHKSIREFRSDFQKLIADSGITRLVVFIDELDRCTPETILETLQAIRLFLAVPKTAFVIAADERLIVHAVRTRYPLSPEEGRNLDIGRHYLEKLVHHPIRIPPLTESEVTSYMNLLFTSLHVESDKFETLCRSLLGESTPTLDTATFDMQRASQLYRAEAFYSALHEDLTLVAQIAPTLAASLDGNPRQVKRFLNMLLQRLSMAASRKVELKRGVLAKLMLLEYFRLEHFRTLANWQATQSGTPEELRVLEGNHRDLAMPEQDDNDASSEVVGDAQQVVSKVALPYMTWLEDPWLREWLNSSPSLQGVDLRPYFYIARERLGYTGISVDALSGPAMATVELLLSSSGVDMGRGVESARQLSEGDLAAVIQALIAAARRSEGSENLPLDRLIRVAEVQTSTIGEVVEYLRQVPPGTLRPGIVPRLTAAARATESAPIVRELFREWERQNVNLRLQAAAKEELQNGNI